MDEFKPKQAHDFTVQEKIILFNKLLASANLAYDDIINKNENEDTAHYIYEETMGWLGNGVWKAINSR